MGVQVTDVQTALKGASYPAQKEDLVDLAESNDADEDVLAALRDMADDTFDSPADVMEALKGSLGDD